MSKFSGICDFADEVFNSKDNILSKKIYCDKMLLRFDHLDDLIPFYPYIVASSTNDSICLTESYLDRRETEKICNYIPWVLNQVREWDKRDSDLTPEEINSTLDSHPNYVPFSVKKYMLSQAIKNPEIKTMPDSIGILKSIRKEIFPKAHTDMENYFREAIISYAADKSFGKIYTLRGKEFTEALNKKIAQIPLEENLAKSYFNEDNDKDEVAIDIPKEPFRHNFMLTDLVLKVSEYDDLVRQFGFNWTR